MLGICMCHCMHVIIRFTYPLVISGHVSTFDLFVHVFQHPACSCGYKYYFHFQEDTLLKLRDFAPFAIEASVIRVKHCNCQNLKLAKLY